MKQKRKGIVSQSKNDGQKRRGDNEKRSSADWRKRSDVGRRKNENGRKKKKLGLEKNERQRPSLRERECRKGQGATVDYRANFSASIRLSSDSYR